MASERVPIAIATNAVGKAVAGHTIDRKLAAVKQHGFDGVELAFECLENHATLDKFNGISVRAGRLRAAAADIRSKASALSLEIIALNPFGFYDGLVEPADIEERLQEAELWLQLCQILDAPILQVGPFCLRSDYLTEIEYRVVLASTRWKSPSPQTFTRLQPMCEDSVNWL